MRTFLRPFRHPHCAPSLQPVAVLLLYHVTVCIISLQRGLFATGERPLDDGEGNTHASAAQKVCSGGIVPFCDTYPQSHMSAQIWRYAEVVDLLNAVIDGSGVVAAIGKGVALSGTAQDAGFFAMVTHFVLLP